MNRLILFLPVLILFFAACGPDPHPNADFIVSSHQVGAYETVEFTNTSSDIPGECEWDFGDGTYSNAINATHYYVDAGTYTVTLTLYDHSVIVSQASATIEVFTTALTVTVKEYGTERVVADASVILYPTKDDWDFETNSIVEGTTNADGVVRFVNLDPVIYFVDVWHQNYNNYQLASEDVGWIMTSQLLPDGETAFLAYVDFVASASPMAGKKTVQYPLRDVERRMKKDVN